MATIDSWPIIDMIIRNDGYYEDDARVALVVEYTNAYGKTTWAVTWVNEPLERQIRYLVASRYVQNPRILWSAVQNDEQRLQRNN